MPNWTANELYVSFSSQEEKEQFKQIAQSQDQQFSFNGFIPMPDRMLETTYPHQEPEEFVYKLNQRNKTNYKNLTDVIKNADKLDADTAVSILYNMEFHRKIGFYNWYDWSIHNWGVKWDAGHSQLIEETDTTLSYNFDTAWDTPETFFRSLFAMYPHLEFRVVTFSMESDYYYEIVKVDGKYQAAHEYESFREAIEDGQLGGVSEWQDLFTDED
jgi:hypothetical protein